MSAFEEQTRILEAHKIELGLGHQVAQKSTMSGTGANEATPQHGATPHILSIRDNVSKGTANEQDSPCFAKGKGTEAHASKLQSPVLADKASTTLVSDSDGGVPVHPATKETPQTHATNESSRTSSSEDEMALVPANGAFNKHNDVFSAASPPPVPKSVPPANNGLANRYNRQPDNRRGFNASFSNPSVAGRNSVSSNDSSGWASSGSRGSNASFPDMTSQQLGQIQSALMTTKQSLNISPGVTGEAANKHGAMILEISHKVNTYGHTIMRQRDEAVRMRIADSEKFKHSLYDSNKSQADRDKLQSELQLAMQREKLLQERVEFYNEQVDSLKRSIESLNTESNSFKDYHETLCKRYERQDEKHYEQIRNLETEIHNLRVTVHNLKTRNSAAPSQCLERADAFSPPSIPESTASVEEAGDDSVSRVTDSIIFKGKTPNRGAYKPNPSAPAFAPVSKRFEEFKHRATQSASSSDELGRSKTPGGAPLNRLPDEIESTPGKPGNGLPPGNRKRAMTLLPSVFPPYDENLIPSGPAKPADNEEDIGANNNLFGDPSRTKNALGNPDREDEWTANDVRAAIAHMYEMAKGIVYNLHKAKISPNVSDDMLHIQEPETWALLNNLVYPDKPEAAAHTRFLLATEQYRPYFIQRVMLDYIFKTIMTPDIFLGFSSEMDKLLGALQGQIGNFANVSQRTSSKSRQRTIEEHARLIKSLRDHKDARKFRNDVVDHHARVLTNVLTPLQNNNVPDEMALKAMRILIRGAYNISMRIWSSNMTLHYFFPETGSKFLVATMEASNGNILGSSAEHLQFSQYRISLVIGPTLTLRDDRESSLLRTYGIRKAQVLVMK